MLFRTRPYDFMRDSHRNKHLHIFHHDMARHYLHHLGGAGVVNRGTKKTKLSPEGRRASGLV